MWIIYLEIFRCFKLKCARNEKYSYCQRSFSNGQRLTRHSSLALQSNAWTGAFDPSCTLLTGEGPDVAQSPSRAAQIRESKRMEIIGCSAKERKWSSNEMKKEIENVLNFSLLPEYVTAPRLMNRFRPSLLVIIILSYLCLASPGRVGVARWASASRVGRRAAPSPRNPFTRFDCLSQCRARGNPYSPRLVDWFSWLHFLCNCFLEGHRAPVCVAAPRVCVRWNLIVAPETGKRKWNRIRTWAHVLFYFCLAEQRGIIEFFRTAVPCRAALSIALSRAREKPRTRTLMLPDFLR